jgi:HSP20 family protein
MGNLEPRKEGQMATLVRWEPFREIASLQSEMSRLMNSVLTGNGETSTRTWVPAVDVWETDKELVYAFDLPGIPEDKISIEFEDGALIVSAERERSQETEEENFYRFERRFGSFSRTVGLPQGVSEDSINADYKDGVLEVHVTKPEQPKPRRIEIGTGSKKTIEGSAKKS